MTFLSSEMFYQFLKMKTKSRFRDNTHKIFEPNRMMMRKIFTLSLQCLSLGDSSLSFKFSYSQIIFFYIIADHRFLLFKNSVSIKLFTSNFEIDPFYLTLVSFSESFLSAQKTKLLASENHVSGFSIHSYHNFPFHCYLPQSDDTLQQQNVEKLLVRETDRQRQTKK